MIKKNSDELAAELGISAIAVKPTDKAPIDRTIRQGSDDLQG